MNEESFQKLAKQYSSWNIKDLVSYMEELREKRDYERSDEIRDFIAELGLSVQNTQYGTLVTRRNAQ